MGGAAALPRLLDPHSGLEGSIGGLTFAFPGDSIEALNALGETIIAPPVPAALNLKGEGQKPKK